MGRHTPGPWQIEKDGVSSTNAPDDGDIICDAPTYTEHSMKRWDANARLIAAAPEMLEALRAITDHFAAVMNGPQMRHVHFVNGVEGIPTIEAARVAISRATGGGPA